MLGSLMGQQKVMNTYLNSIVSDTTYGAYWLAMDYDQLAQSLESAKSDTRCCDVMSLLEEAGFQLRKGKRGNHYTFMHPSIRNFHGGSFDCGHGKNSKIKRIPYIRNILKIVQQFEQELKEHFKRKNHD